MRSFVQEKVIFLTFGSSYENGYKRMLIASIPSVSIVIRQINWEISV